MLRPFLVSVGITVAAFVVFAGIVMAVHDELNTDEAAYARCVKVWDEQRRRWCTPEQERHMFPGWVQRCERDTLELRQIKCGAAPPEHHEYRGRAPSSL